MLCEAAFPPVEGELRTVDAALDRRSPAPYRHCQAPRALALVGAASFLRRDVTT
jgi:hypothetical protein